MFFPAASIIFGILIFSIVYTKRAAALFNGAEHFIVEEFGWLLLSSVTLFLGFALFLAFSRFGEIRLGSDSERPEFHRLSWFAMLFSAGMGIGLVFFGVAEPMLHYAAPPFGEARTSEAAQRALGITFFHWGLHAWGVYIVMGLCVSYFAYRRKLPLAIRSVLHPLLGERIHGPLGHCVDLLAVFGTVFGLATSLGLGAMQINAGLHHLFAVSEGRSVQVAIIVLVTAAATLSLVSGVGRGIRRLSELNLLLATLLLAFVFIAGPTRHILLSVTGNLVEYGAQIARSITQGSSLGSKTWQASWTIFYWAWWIAWAPFVGLFIARISKGRTIREFVLGVLLVPTLVTLVWLAVFGNTALHLEVHQGGIAAAVQENTATAIYQVLARLPISRATSFLAVAVVITFFVTSSDSGSFVVDILTSGGHPDPPIWQRVFWSATEGVVAIVLLLAGGLKALQSAVIATGLPFAVILLVMCGCLLRELMRDPKTVKHASAAKSAE